MGEEGFVQFIHFENLFTYAWGVVVVRVGHGDVGRAWRGDGEVIVMIDVGWEGSRVAISRLVWWLETM